MMVRDRSAVKNLLVKVSRGTSPVRSPGGRSDPAGHSVGSQFHLPQDPNVSLPAPILQAEPVQPLGRPPAGVLLRRLADQERAADPQETRPALGGDGRRAETA